jgi:hypothetical protein
MGKPSDDNSGKDAGTTVTDVRSVVENANAEDENRRKSGSGDADDDDLDDDDDEGDDDGSDANKKDDSANSDDADDSDNDESDDDSDEDSKAKPGDKKSSADRQFTQFAGDGTDEAYISNLEKGYKNSSEEAIRLNTELTQNKSRVDAIMRLAATDPELATKLNAALKGDSTGDGDGSDAIDNPFVADMKAQWEQKSEEEISAIIDANPELITDPKLAKDVQKWMGIFSEQYRKDNSGRLMTGGAAMEAAMKHLGVEDKRSKQDLAQGAKTLAAPTRHKGSKKKSNASKKEFTEAQLDMARNMGKDRDWLEKNT